MIDMFLDHNPSDEDLQALLKYCLKKDHLARAHCLLQRNIEVLKFPKTTSLDGLALLFRHQSCSLANRKITDLTLAKWINDCRDMDGSIIGCLKDIKKREIPLPSVESHFQAVLYNSSLPVEQTISLLDSLIKFYGHDINSVFSCEECGRPTNLLALGLVYMSEFELESFLERLVDRGVNVNCPGILFSALVLVCRGTPDRHRDSEDQLIVARMLLRNGADVNGIRRAALPTASSTPGPENVHPLDQTPLMFAIARKEYALACLLIEHGADVNRGSISPLSVALRSQDTEGNEDGEKLIDLLIRKGARVRELDKMRERELDSMLRIGTADRWKEICHGCRMYPRGGSI